MNCTVLRQGMTNKVVADLEHLVYPEVILEDNMVKTSTPLWRPAVLNDPVKKLIRFEPRHIRILERYAKRNELPGVNAAVRDILDSYDFK